MCREPGLVDLPVIQRHAFLSGEDPEDGLGVCRSGWNGRFVAKGGGDVVETGRRVPPAPSGSSMAASRSNQPWRRRSAAGIPSGLRCRVARDAVSAALAEVVPRSAMVASMSTLRLEKARRTA